MDLTQRILGIVAAAVADQQVHPMTFAGVVGTTPARAAQVLLGEEALSRDELRYACEYLEIDLGAALGSPGLGGPCEA